LLTLFVIGLVVGFGGSVGAIHTHAWVALAVLALPGILAIVGGVFSLRRRVWIMALIGSVCVVPLGFGIAAVVLLIPSRNEFS
jgi:uncharacterized membrane protein YGL010W